MLGLVIGLLPLLAAASNGKIQPYEKRITFYEANLVCPAAPQIGCGSAAKPVLLALERNPDVSEAWLNRAGTLIAVVWKDRAPRKREKLVQTALDEPKVHELKEESRAEALKTFMTGKGWYRGAAVDRLSEEEAGINAAKLVAKIRELISITEAKAETLQHEFAAVLGRKLTQGGSREETEAELMRVCQTHLDQNDLTTLHTAYESGAFSHLLRR